MGTPLRTLLIEDSENDAELLLRCLRRGGYEPQHQRVQTGPEMQEALRSSSWDFLFSDWSMPSFTAPEALAILHQTGLDLPFVIVSGTVGEDAAVAAMRAGAHDYLVKGKLTRLVAVVEREVREARMRSERREMESQLLLADRMSAVGLLAASVAHEINNPLASVIANLEFVALDLGALPQAAEPLLEAIRDASESAQRVRQIVRDLKVFSHSGDKESLGPVDVHSVLESSLRMAQTELRHRARTTKEFGEIPPVQGSDARLGQVFLNLLVNAAQAIEEGHAAEHEIRLTTRREEGNQVVVSVKDTGSGMPPEILQRIFDPFFTTKPKGVGTGLGLAISRRIVTELRGRLWAESTPGKGSVFHVALPAASARPPTESPRSAPAALHRRGKVLVIDDEMVVGRTLRRVLRAHDLVDVNTGQAALSLLARGSWFDVIFCDVMMPNMTGMDFYLELQRLAPRQAERVVFLTGGAFTEVARRFLERVSNPRVEKPFDVASIRAVVEAFLARPGA